MKKLSCFVFLLIIAFSLKAQKNFNNYFRFDIGYERHQFLARPGWHTNSASIEFEKSFKSSPFSRNYRLSFGANDTSQFHMHLPMGPALGLGFLLLSLGLSYKGSLTMLMMFPEGIAYNPIQTEKCQLGLYANFLGFDINFTNRVNPKNRSLVLDYTPDIGLKFNYFFTENFYATTRISARYSFAYPGWGFQSTFGLGYNNFIEYKSPAIRKEPKYDDRPLVKKEHRYENKPQIRYEPRQNTVNKSFDNLSKYQNERVLNLFSNISNLYIKLKKDNLIIGSIKKNEFNYEFFNLSKKYLTLVISSDSTETHTIVLRKKLKNILNPFDQKNYVLAEDSRNIRVKLQYKNSYLFEKFNQIEKSQNIQDFVTYMKMYPNSFYYTKAQNKKDSLELVFTLRKKDFSAIEEYIKFHPKSAFIKEAKRILNDSLDARLRYLEKKEKEKRESFERSYDNFVESYRLYFITGHIDRDTMNIIKLIDELKKLKEYRYENQKLDKFEEVLLWNLPLTIAYSNSLNFLDSKPFDKIKVNLLISKLNLYSELNNDKFFNELKLKEVEDLLNTLKNYCKYYERFYNYVMAYSEEGTDNLLDEAGKYIKGYPFLNKKLKEIERTKKLTNLPAVNTEDCK
jgi:hypothetical protein